MITRQILNNSNIDKNHNSKITDDIFLYLNQLLFIFIEILEYFNDD